MSPSQDVSPRQSYDQSKVTAEYSTDSLQLLLEKLQSLPFTAVPEDVKYGYNIVVNITKATDLPLMDGLLGTVDPYVVATAVPLDPGAKTGAVELVKYKTATVPNTRNPIFDEFFELGNMPAGSTITFDVWDADRGSQDDYVGKAGWNFNPTELADIATADGSLVGGSDKWGGVKVSLNLQHPTKRRFLENERGILELQICYRPSLKAGTPALLGPIRFKQYISTAPTRLIGEWLNAETMSFSTYKLFLPEVHVLGVFGSKRMPWNKAYDKAVTIFTNPYMHNTIKKQHSTLYSSTIRSSRCGVLATAKDFFELFKNGQRGGERRYFTYALVPDGSLRCSETGAAFFRDIMSKHAMHAAGAEEVLYAGEFCIVPDDVAPGGYRLVIDNNSGTYAPEREALPLLQKMFKVVLPDLEVEVLARDDPKLKEYHSQCPSRMATPTKV